MKSSSMFGSIKPSEIEEGVYGAQIGLEHELDNTDMTTRALRKGLRGRKIGRKDIMDLNELEDGLDAMMNSQLTHHMNKLVDKSGYTPAYVKDPSGVNDYLALKRSSNKNYINEVHKFQPVVLEKPL